MGQLRIFCTGLTYKEANELADLLRAMNGVDSARVPIRTMDNLPGPGVMNYWIAPPQMALQPLTIVLSIGGFLATEFVSGALKEAGKDAYGAIKKEIVQELEGWKQDKMSGQSKVRIQWELSENGELIRKIQGTR